MAAQTVFNFPSKMTHTFELRSRIQLETEPGFQFDASFLNQGVFKSLSTKMYKVDSSFPGVMTHFDVSLCRRQI